MLQPDIQQIVSQALSFLILLWLLRRFAWRPLLGVLDDRKRHIEEALQQAAQSREDVTRLQEEYTARLADIDAEARQKIQQAVLDAKRIAMEVQEQSRAQGNTILAKAKDTATLEVAKAKVTLRDQLVEMTVEAVGRVLKRTLDAKQDRQLVDQVVDELEQEAARS